MEEVKFDGNFVKIILSEVVFSTSIYRGNAKIDQTAISTIWDHLRVLPG